jgi:hypothetical protein
MVILSPGGKSISLAENNTPDTRRDRSDAFSKQQPDGFYVNTSFVR